MITKKFICRLETDVVVGKTAATIGNHETLDYIPGSSFMGVAAKAIYDESDMDTFLIFHSGKVRFGDAHPIINGRRAFRTPASYYSEKNNENIDYRYLHHLLPRAGFRDIQGQVVLLRQERQGFVVFNSKKYDASFFEVEKMYSQKSAYDRHKRKAQDSKMFGYESIVGGVDMCFEVSFDNDVKETIIKKVVDSIKGLKIIGKSTTAQYGLVHIEECDFDLGFESIEGSDFIMLYAESRLLFIDDYGQFCVTPKASDFGVNDGVIDWEKSQVRIFQYAPFNKKRMHRDADRFGIEKGSVICVKMSKGIKCDKYKPELFAGCLIQEGFGKVLVNPDFLEGDGINEGKVKYKFSISQMPLRSIKTSRLDGGDWADEYDKLLYDLLVNLNHKVIENHRVYQLVNSFIAKSGGLMKAQILASQWGTIRMKAMVSKNKQDLYQKLFNQEVGFLLHGVSKEKWEGQRIKVFKEFFNELDEDIAIEAVINLSAEMAKLSKRGGGRI